MKGKVRSLRGKLEKDREEWKDRLEKLERCLGREKKTEEGKRKAEGEKRDSKSEKDSEKTGCTRKAKKQVQGLGNRANHTQEKLERRRVIGKVARRGDGWGATRAGEHEE